MLRALLPCKGAVICASAAAFNELIVTALIPRMRSKSSSACAAVRACSRTSESSAATTDPVAPAAISDR